MIFNVRLIFSPPAALKAKPSKFSSDEECLDYLKSVNPGFDYDPPGFDYFAAIRDAHALHQRLQNEFGPTVTIDDAFQDATCHVQLWLPPDTHLSLSNFERLATVGHDEAAPDPRLSRIIHILEESGYTYIPFRIIKAADADLPPHCSGLECQLFNYV